MVFEEDYGAMRAHRGHRVGGPTAIPSDTKFQLTLAAINTLFRLLHTIHDNAKAVWEEGGAELVKRIILLATHLTTSFEDPATKLLVVFFSHRHVQAAVRKAGSLLPTQRGRPVTRM
jgi:hypothetical protein